MKLRIAIVLAALSMTAGFVHAQPRPGQSYLLTSVEGLHTVDRTTKVMTTIEKFTSSVPDYSAVTMNAGNTSASLVLNAGSATRIMSYSPRNGVTTLVSNLPSAFSAFGITVDQDARLVIAAGLDGSLVKTTGFLNNSATRFVSGLPGTATIGVCIDDDTGDYVVATMDSPGKGSILRVNARSKSVSTLASGFGQLRGIDHDQTTGRFVITSVEKPTVRVIDRSGKTIATRDIQDARNVRIDDVTGLIHIVTYKRIVVLDRALKIVDQFGPYAISFFSGIELWGSRKVGPGSHLTNGGGKRGTNYVVNGQFHDSPNRSYVCAIGISGLRPGLGVGGRTININPDALFFTTVAGGLPLFTSGFVGTTSATGQFRASFVVPRISVTTGAVNLVGAVVNPGKPSNLDLAPSLTIRVMP